MDTNNDVIIVDSTSNDPLLASLSEHEEKPLMMLFKRLIGNDNKQNTVLTNAQIIDILQKEFHMDMHYTHELEIDIYLNILKKFLKDWPQWDEFDTAINVLKHQKEVNKIKTMLEVNYESLKTYLKSTLESVEPLLKNVIKEVKRSTAKEVEKDDDVVLQIQCTREQLNQLFFRRPHPLYNNTIFNIKTSPAKIRFSTFNLDTILNWPFVCINININGMFVFRRSLLLILKHVLVNKKLNIAKKPLEILNTNLQVKGQKFTTVDLDVVLKTFDEISKLKCFNDEIQQITTAACKIIKSDFEYKPQRIHIPAIYRKNLSASPYVRYLYQEVDNKTGFPMNNYDLHLEETAIPQFQVNFMKFSPITQAHNIINSGTLVKIECIFCQIKFSDANILQKLVQHFEEYHQGEPDWHCPRCKKMFPIEHLIRYKWGHICKPAAGVED